MDEDTSQEVINPNEDEEVEAQDNASEETQEEVQEDSQQTQQDDGSTDDQQVKTEEEAERQPSRREQLRIQSLLRKYPETYREEIKQQSQDSGINYRDMIDADDEVYNQLSQASRQYGDQRYQQGQNETKRDIDRIRFENRLEVDAPRVEAKYPQLDKTSDEFNPAVADSLNQMYLSTVGYDPNTGYVQNASLRYSEYIDAMFELVNEAASRQTETTRRNVTKQASRAGLRPDGSSPTRSLDLSKDPSQMSDAELDAALKSMGVATKPKR